MPQSLDLTARESEIIRVLRALGEAGNDFVVIGGYAVSALGLHRFSVDCDLVTGARHVPGLEDTLLGEGYSKKRGRPLPEGVVMREYAKRVGRAEASVELYIDNLVSRATRGTWSYRFIRDNSLERIVVGVTDSCASRVVGRDLLIAMKLHAARSQDLGDVVVLSEEADWDGIAVYAACGEKDELTRLLESSREKISSEEFASDLRSTFALRRDVTRLIQRASQGLARLKTRLAVTSFKSSL